MNKDFENSSNMTSVLLGMSIDIANPVMDSDRGTLEKILAMAILGLGSFFAGMLPAIIPEHHRQRYPLTTSLLLCFGAGILLATSLVHILPEVRNQMNSSFAEITVCGGFFIIYFIDEFIHYFFGEFIQHTHQSAPALVTPNGGNNYGTLTETSPLIVPSSEGQNGHDHNHHHHHVDSTTMENHEVHANHLQCEQTETDIAGANARICHSSHVQPCERSMTGTLGLFVALSLHSAIEGLAIGVQNSSTKVLFLLGAVSCHKFVMGFCLGLEARSNPRSSRRTHLIGILVFALGAVLGIGIGILIVDISAGWSTKTLSIIQALAGGTLLYVAVCEVMPREKATWHQNSTRRFAGLSQFLAVAIGFSTMSIINYFLSDDD